MINSTSQLFYFYRNSLVRISGLQAVETLLETPELKLKKKQRIWDGSLTTMPVKLWSEFFPAVCAREAEESICCRSPQCCEKTYLWCISLHDVWRLTHGHTLESCFTGIIHWYVSASFVNVEALELLCMSKEARSNTLYFDLQNSLAGCEIDCCHSRTKSSAWC